MAIGKRIRRIRLMRGLTQREVGEAAGFNVKSADIRVTQYESEARIPQEKMTKAIANALRVDTMAIDVPNVDNEYGLMQTLFYLEDEHGFKINDINGKPCLVLDISSFDGLRDRLVDWQKEYNKFINGEISKEEYDEWRYTYPEIPVKRTRLEIDKIRNKE